MTDALVTEADRAAARDEVNRAARGAMYGSFVLVFVALVLSKLVERAVGDNLYIEIGAPVATVGPLLLLIAFGAKNRGIADTAQRLANERQVRIDVDRRAFGTQLLNALEMTNDESEALDLAQECSVDDARAVFERVQQRVSALGDDGRIPRFTASYGSTDSDGAVALDELLAEADVALYEAKAAGKNRLVSRSALRSLSVVDRRDEAV